MTANKVPGSYYLSASIGYVIGIAAANRIKKRRSTYREPSIDRARRIMNNR